VLVVLLVLKVKLDLMVYPVLQDLLDFEEKLVDQVLLVLLVSKEIKVILVLKVPKEILV